MSREVDDLYARAKRLQREAADLRAAADRAREEADAAGRMADEAEEAADEAMDEADDAFEAELEEQRRIAELDRRIDEDKGERWRLLIESQRLKRAITNAERKDG